MLSSEGSFIEPIDAEVIPMSLSGTSVFSTSGESNGLDNGVDPRAAFTRNLENKKRFRSVESIRKFYGILVETRTLLRQAK